jgi:cytochrome oxidase assembly protein ShyY1
MYRFLLRPRWIGFHLLVAAGVVLMVNLGFWQLRRLDQRQDFNATVEARFDIPAAPLDTVLAEGTPDEVEWRRVIATGEYLPDEQVIVVNRSQGGRAGQNVVTPMRLDDGRVLVVNRGFVPLGADVPAPPTCFVEIEGRARASQERRTGQLSDPGDGELAEVQRIDIPRLAQQLPGDVVEAYVDVLTSSPPEPAGGPQPVAAPELGEGPHLSYAVQWFVFAVCVVVGWVLAVRRSIARRRHDVTVSAAAADAPTPAGSPPADADEPATAPT